MDGPEINAGSNNVSHYFVIIVYISGSRLHHETGTQTFFLFNFIKLNCDTNY